MLEKVLQNTESLLNSSTQKVPARREAETFFVPNRYYDAGIFSLTLVPFPTAESMVRPFSSP